ncbi:MAG: RDD family protein [Candidatus Hodarchaeota archaeon]
MEKSRRQEQIDSYIREIDQLLPYPEALKSEALSELLIDVESAMEDTDIDSPAIVFGNPLEVAKNLSQAQNWHQERATWLIRLGAWLIDTFIQMIIILICLGIGFLLFILAVMPYEELKDEFSRWDDPNYDGSSILNTQGILLVLWMLILFITTLTILYGYYIILEHEYGVTIGKKICRIAVVDQSGIKISWKQAIIRNLSKILIIEELLPFDVILGMVLEKVDPEKTRKQRGSDILAETIVIKQK